MTAIRAKFSCVEKIQNEHPDTNTWNIKFRPVIGGSEENREFYRWTPGGEIQLQVVSSQAASRFNTGHDYYVDFTEVTE